MANFRRRHRTGQKRPCYCKGKWDKFITGIPKPSLRRKLQDDGE